MNVLIGRRRSGKTTKILDLLKKTGGVLIVSTIAHKEVLLDAYSWLKERKDVKVISWSQNIHGEIFGFEPNIVYFDDIHRILESAVGGEIIHAISLTADHVWIDFEREEKR